MNIRLLCPQNLPGKNTGVGCHFLLQGIFLTQGLNPCLLQRVVLFFFFTTSATWEAHPKEGTNYYFIISIIALDRAGIRDK